VEALQRMRQRWFDVVVDAVDDPAVARAVLLIGDGLYYNAALNDGWTDVTSPEEPTDVDALLDVVADLIRLRAGAHS
jgi:hypothetical protein